MWPGARSSRGTPSREAASVDARDRAGGARVGYDGWVTAHTRAKDDSDGGWRDPVRAAAVVFDFDGTLVDTEMLQFEAWREILGHQGAAFEIADWRHAVGKAPDAFDPVSHVERRDHRRLDEAAVRRDLTPALEGRFAAGALRPGVRGWIDDARRRGLALAVASNSSAYWVHSWLERLGIEQLFAAVASGDEALRPKPAPDLYRLAVERLGVPPAAAWAVEDSPLGCQAALAAGLRCVAVPNDFTRPLAFPAGARLSNGFGPPPWAEPV